MNKYTLAHTPEIIGGEVATLSERESWFYHKTAIAYTSEVISEAACIEYADNKIVEARNG